MNKYIDANMLEKDGWSIQRTRQVSSTEMVYEIKKPTDFPAADVEEVKRGEWEKIMEHRVALGIFGGKDVCIGYACNVCGEQADYMTPYCHNCGARMVGVADGE